MTLLEHERHYLRPLPERPLDVALVRRWYEFEPLVCGSEGSINRFRPKLRSLQLRLDPLNMRIYHGTRLLAEHPQSYAQPDRRRLAALSRWSKRAVPFAAPLHNACPHRWDAFRRLGCATDGQQSREDLCVLQLCQRTAEASRRRDGLSGRSGRPQRGRHQRIVGLGA